MDNLKNMTINDAQKTAMEVVDQGTWMNGKTSEQVAQLRGHVLAEFNVMDQQAPYTVQDMVNKINQNMNTLGPSSFTWGADMADQLAAGMMAHSGAVGTAAAHLAVEVSRYLQHSRPETGPLADDDVWFYHLTENLANGMTKGIPLVTASAQQLGLQLKGALGGGPLSPTAAMQQLQLQSQYNLGAAGTGTVVIQNVLDGKVIGQSALDLVSGQLKTAGIGLMGR
jgi:hypothetical protein